MNASNYTAIRQFCGNATHQFPPCPRCTLTSLARINLSINSISFAFAVIDFLVLAYLAYSTAKALVILSTIPKKPVPARI